MIRKTRRCAANDPLSSQVEADLFPCGILSSLLGTLVLVRVLLHDLGCQLAQKGGLAVS